LSKYQTIELYADGNNTWSVIDSQSTLNTPAIFDNSNKTATTAFVQRALGNKSTIASGITGTLTMGLAHLGGFFTFNGGSGTPTATLPDLTTITTASSVYFYNTGSVAATINTYGGTQNIGIASGATIQSLTLPPGSTVVLSTVSGATMWFIEGGSLATKYDSNFGSSLAANGYQKLPSGLIIQWGSVNSANVSTTTVSFPQAFPTTCFQVIACGYNVSGGVEAFVTTNSPGSLTNASFNAFFAAAPGATLSLASSNQVRIQYFAIGY
jgi:hypothetical protein